MKAPDLPGKPDGSEEFQSTRWPVIWMAVAAGVAAALQVGKASAGLPLLQTQFGAGMASLSLYLSMLSVSAALVGAMMGMLTQRIGALQSSLLGLTCLGVGSLWSAAAPDWGVLMTGRLIEAIGLPFVVSAIPGLIQTHSFGRSRILAMGLWSTWLPLGIALAMALSVLLLPEGFAIGDQAEGWRSFFLVCGLVPLGAALALWRVVGRTAEKTGRAGSAKAHWRFFDPAIFTAAGLFCLFSGMYLILQAFLPTVAVRALGLSLREATLFGGFAALLVIPGNMASSTLIARGTSANRVLGACFAGMVLFGVAFFSSGVSDSLRIVAGLAFMLAAGGPPGVIWSQIPALAQRSGAGPASISGVVYQFAGIGQLCGPIAAGFAVERSGSWGAAGLVLCAAGAVAFAVMAFSPSIDEQVGPV